ncbi:hypothetical protein RhiirA4_341805 [Rhizophagus irregularis]|uniref:Uncharacterized protein n=1 Tax=Rhizophagus irregularis TaxID=588596 RepID=A0A2I1GCT0_9GLOM|nr:hypothetical protein RhiirA4_341805 [Rhizophagus irregularis]
MCREIFTDQKKRIGKDFKIQIKCLPILTTGHDFLHSCLHFFGLHLSELTMAILVCFSLIMAK